MDSSRAQHYLEKLYNPRHIAMVGFSQDRTKAGARYLDTLRHQGYKGEISLVGRATGEFEGLPLYKDVCSLPSTVELAFCMLGAESAATVLPEIASRGVPMAVVFTSGFAEMGGIGAERQQQMVERCKSSGMRLLGPNCPGYLYRPSGVNLTGKRDRPAGPLGLIAQSGNVAGTLFDQAERYDIGFNAFVGVGNQSDIPIHDHIEYLGNDDQTEVILLYIEGLVDGQGRQFSEVCRKISRNKPIVALKGGKLDAGMRAASSHTASLSSTEKVYTALFEDCGVIEVDHLEHLLPIAETLYRCPPMRGKRVAIVGSGGGHSTASADEVEGVGLEVPEFSPALQQELGRRLPAFAPKRNPVDMTGFFENDPSLFATLSNLTLDTDKNFNGVLNYGLYGGWPLAANSPHTYTSAAKVLGECRKRWGIPFIMYTPYAYRHEECFSTLRAANIPCYYDLALVARAFAALQKRFEMLSTPISPPDIEIPQATTPTQGPSTEAQACEVLSKHGVAFPRSRQAGSIDDFKRQAEELTFPLVLKALIPGLPHKSELGAVKTGIADLGALVAAARAMERRLEGALGPGHHYGFLLIEDLGRRRELFVGVRRDRLLGTVGVVGYGGVFAEAVSDTSAVLLPATKERVDSTIKRLRAHSLWGAVRGQAALNCESVAKALNGMAAALLAAKNCISVECNPMVVVGGSPIAVDAAFEYAEVETSST